MARLSHFQSNFVAGELSNDISDRIESQARYNGAKRIENFIVETAGLVRRRKGTKFIANSISNNNQSILKEFIFSSEVSYILEFCDNKVRFFTNKARIFEETTLNITNITNATTAVVTTDVNHNYTTGDTIFIKNVAGMTNINNNEYVINVISPTTFELQGTDTTSFNSYVSGGAVLKVYEISSPYSNEDLKSELVLLQIQDIAYIVSVTGKYPIYKLTRLTSVTFSLNKLDIINRPYQDENLVSINNLTLSGGSSWAKDEIITVTAGGFTPFTEDFVDTAIKLKDVSGNDIAEVEITAFTSSTVVSAKIVTDTVPVSLRNTSTIRWSYSTYSSLFGWPKSATFHEQRIIIAKGQRFDASVIGDYENFELGEGEDRGFNRIIASTRGDEIKFLFSDEVLFIGSLGGLWRVKSTNSPALTNQDIDIKKNISYGCSNIQPKSIGDIPVYSQTGNKKARFVEFFFERNKYKSTDVTIFNPEITEERIKLINYQQNPLNLGWFLKENGEVALLLTEENQQILSWSRIKIDGNIESVGIIPTDDISDQVYISTVRNINNVNKRFIEVYEDFEDDYYVDAGLTYNGTKNVTLTFESIQSSFLIELEDGSLLELENGNLLESETIEGLPIDASSDIFKAEDVGKQIREIGNNKGIAAITEYVSPTQVIVNIIKDFTSNVLDSWYLAVNNVDGLEYLAGQKVQIEVDGATFPEQIVDNNGEINLPRFGSIINIGLAFKTEIETLPLEAIRISQILGTTQGKLKNIPEIILNLKNTRGGYIVGNIDKEEPILTRKIKDDMNVAPDKITEARLEFISYDWTREATITIGQREPQPMEIKSISYYVDVNDE